MRKIYWCEKGLKSIGRANVDGTEANAKWIEELPGEPRDVAVDDTYIYWTNFTAGIGRAKLDGSVVEKTWINAASTGENTFGIAVTPTHIYWTQEKSGIGRAAIDGSSVEKEFITLPTKTTVGLAVDSEHLYWGNYGDGKIGRASINGTSVESAWISAATPIPVAVDSTHVYWCDFSNNRLGRAGIGGTSVEPAFVTTLRPGKSSGGWGIAVDAEYLYVGLEENIGRVPIAGGAITTEWLPAAAGAWGVAVEPEEPEPEPEGSWDILAQGFNNTGAWSTETEYHPYDVVTHGGASYICTKAHSAKEPPSAEYWDVLAEKGEAAEAGTGVTPGFHWKFAEAAPTEAGAARALFISGSEYTLELHEEAEPFGALKYGVSAYVEGWAIGSHVLIDDGLDAPAFFSIVGAPEKVGAVMKLKVKFTNGKLPTGSAAVMYLP